MSKTFVVILMLISFFLSSARASAQQNEVAFSLGGTFVPGSTSQFGTPTLCTITTPNCVSFFNRFHISSQISFEGVYARRILQPHVASLYVELPVVGVPSRTLNSFESTFPGFGTTRSRSDFSSVFITPSLRAKFLPDAIVSPFASVGVGVAHFTSHVQGTVLHTDGGSTIVSRTDSQTTAAYQFGGGLDFKTPVRNLGFRLEVRDFLAGRPGFDSGSSDAHNNIFAGAGVVFHF